MFYYHYFYLLIYLFIFKDDAEGVCFLFCFV